MPEAKSIAWKLLIAALGVRLVFIVFFHVGPGLHIEYQHDGEAEHLARTLVHEGRFTNPYVPEASIPSSNRSPLHPLLLALCLKASQGHVPVYYGCVYVLFSFISSLTVVGVAHLAMILFDRRVGVLAGTIAAIYPPSIYYATNATCDATLVSACIVFLSILVTKLKQEPSRLRAAGLGVFSGVAALVNPAILSVVVGYVPVLWLKTGIRPRHRLCLLTITAGCCVLAISPWLVRNRVTFERWVFLRSCLGLNLFLSNSGAGRITVPPSEFALNTPAELAHLRRLGEIDHDRDCAQRAFAWMRANPARFVELCGLRYAAFRSKEVFYGGFPTVSNICVGTPFVLGLCGVVLAIRSRHECWPALTPLVMYPLIYSVTHPEARYRYPIDPFMIMFCAYAVNYMIVTIRKTWAHSGN